MGQVQLDHLFRIVTTVVFFSSILHNFLPPWDFLYEFPRAQRYYRLMIYIVGYTALNARSSMYPAISTKDGTTPSAAVTQKNGKT